MEISEGYMKITKNKYDSIVCGGGPAGMMAAIAAGETGERVLLIEKNKQLGRKLLITGKGRCNLTNATSPENHIEAMRSDPFFYYSAIYKEPAVATMAFFESHGLPLVVERGNRVFPASQQSKDVIAVMEKTLRDEGVAIHLEEEIMEISEDADLFMVKTKEQVYYSQKVIIATGGKSYPATGSTGDGYGFAKAFGHQITKLYPSLVSLEIKETWPREWEGISLKNVGASLWQNKGKRQKLYDNFGDMLFTDKGVSGPLVLSMSRAATYQIDKDLTLEIDLKPALDREVLDKRLQRDFLAYSNKDAINGLDKLLPNRMLDRILWLSAIAPDKKLHSITKEERNNLLHQLKQLTFHIKKTGSFKEAVVTAGGVSVHDIDSSTMESKIIPGLFFAGEILDLDSLTGGYNLQIAFSTGKLAGLSKKTEKLK